MHIRSLLVLSLLVGFFSVPAQEVNLGLHANPIISVPNFNKPTVFDDGILVSWGRVNFNCGLNVNLKMKRVNITTGINMLTKSVSFHQKTDKYEMPASEGGVTMQASSRATGKSSSIEIPLELNWLLHHHVKNIGYDLYFITGASYETNTSQGFSTQGHSISNGSRTYSAGISGIAPSIGIHTDWINIIVGAKINTVINKIGLIDYGLVYHMALEDAGHYRIESEMNNNSIPRTYNGDFYPYLSYLDFRLTYYFLNFEKGAKRKRYKSPRG